MEHRWYIARKRARFKGYSGPVNIPWGTRLEAVDDCLVYHGDPLCLPTSQNALDHFCQDDDGQGVVRGRLVDAITRTLGKPSGARRGLWARVWGDSVCQKYRRPEHEDFWLWSYDFYNAPVDDLRHIAGILGVMV